jgi:hypothetical protein
MTRYRRVPVAGVHEPPGVNTPGYIMSPLRGYVFEPPKGAV